MFMFAPAAQRAELNQMLAALTDLIDDWEASHFGFLFPDLE